MDEDEMTEKIHGMNERISDLMREIEAEKGSSEEAIARRGKLTDEMQSLRAERNAMTKMKMAMVVEAFKSKGKKPIEEKKEESVESMAEAEKAEAVKRGRPIMKDEEKKTRRLVCSKCGLVRVMFKAAYDKVAAKKDIATYRCRKCRKPEAKA